MSGKQQELKEQPRKPAFATKVYTGCSIAGLVVMINFESIYFIQLIGIISFAVCGFIATMLERKARFHLWPSKVIGMAMIIIVLFDILKKKMG